MTTAIITTIRQQLRKRWVRCAACLVLLFAGYVATTGQAVGLAFHPLVRSLPCHPQICNCVFAFYGPVLAVTGSNRCPCVIRQLIMLGMSDRRNDIGSELALTASVYYDHLPCMRDGMTQFGMYLDQREFSLPSAYGLDDDVEYFPLSRETNPRAWSRLQEYKLVLDSSYGHHEHRVAVAPLLEGLVSLPPVTNESEEPQLPLEVCPSSRLGGSLALPEESENSPFTKGPTPEEARGLMPPRSEDQVGRSDLVTNPARWAAPDERLASCAGRQCFDDRPDLIQFDSDSDRSTVDTTLQPFRVNVIDIRDEQDLPNASPNPSHQAAVYTFRVASPDLLLDEAHLVKLQNCVDSFDENEKGRIFATLGDRIVCQKDFPKRDYYSEFLQTYITINR